MASNLVYYFNKTPLAQRPPDVDAIEKLLRQGRVFPCELGGPHNLAFFHAHIDGPSRGFFNAEHRVKYLELMVDQLKRLQSAGVLEFERLGVNNDPDFLIMYSPLLVINSFTLTKMMVKLNKAMLRSEGTYKAAFTKFKILRAHTTLDVSALTINAMPEDVPGAYVKLDVVPPHPSFSRSSPAPAVGRNSGSASGDKKAQEGSPNAAAPASSPPLVVSGADAERDELDVDVAEIVNEFARRPSVAPESLINPELLAAQMEHEERSSLALSAGQAIALADSDDESGSDYGDIEVPDEAPPEPPSGLAMFQNAHMRTSLSNLYARLAIGTEHGELTSKSLARSIRVLSKNGVRSDEELDFYLSLADAASSGPLNFQFFLATAKIHEQALVSTIRAHLDALVQSEQILERQQQLLRDEEEAEAQRKEKAAKSKQDKRKDPRRAPTVPGAGFGARRRNNREPVEAPMVVHVEDFFEPNVLRQSTSDLRELYKGALRAISPLFHLCRHIAAAGRCEKHVYWSIKQTIRARMKGLHNYRGDYSRLCDIARCSIVFEDMLQIQDALDSLASLQERYPTVRVKDRFLEGTAMGYRDVLLNVVVDGHICEIQMHVKDMWVVMKERGRRAHKWFEKMVFVNEEFEGQLSPNLLRHGWGVNYFANGCMYVGQWRLGKMHGFGRFFWAVGDVYEGDFYEDAVTGYGSCKYADGCVYRGDWVNGEKDGFGTYHLYDSSWYEGSWCKGKKHGLGTYVWSNGDVYKGWFHEGEIHGEGTKINRDGSWYEGDWVQGKRHGKGLYVWPGEQRQYVGEWRDDDINGVGTLTTAQGYVYDGEWRHGQMCGNGVVTSPDGTKFKGEFRGNQMHGLGEWRTVVLGDEGAREETVGTVAYREGNLVPVEEYRAEDFVREEDALVAEPRVKVDIASRILARRAVPSRRARQIRHSLAQLPQGRLVAAPGQPFVDEAAQISWQRVYRPWPPNAITLKCTDSQVDPSGRGATTLRVRRRDVKKSGDARVIDPESAFGQRYHYYTLQSGVVGYVRCEAWPTVRYSFPRIRRKKKRGFVEQAAA